MFSGQTSWSLPEHEVAPFDGFSDQPGEITVELRGAFEHCVTVSPLDAISSLSSIPGLRYVHRGRLLCPALSFRFLNVRDGDEIFVIAPIDKSVSPRPRCAPGFTQDAVDRLRQRFDARYSQRFRDPDAVFEQLRDASNPITARESARLADVFRTRVEENRVAYRKVFGRLERLESGARQSAVETAATVVPEKAMEPSTELLPQVWIRRDSGSNAVQGL
jgi:hypothetical protein